MGIELHEVPVRVQLIIAGIKLAHNELILVYVSTYVIIIFCGADFGDFDNTTVQVTFFPDEENPINEHSVPITVVDDDIDEAIEQIFVVTLKHKESIREESISLETRNSSLCRIIDNDGKGSRFSIIATCSYAESLTCNDGKGSHISIIATCS